MPFDEREHSDPDFEQFLQVLCIEAAPNELVEQALKLCLDTAKRLPLERFVLKLYELREDVALSFSVVGRLTYWLLNHPGVIDCWRFSVLKNSSWYKGTVHRN